MKESIKKKLNDNVAIIYMMLIISIIMIYIVTIQNSFDIKIEYDSDNEGAIQVFYCDNDETGFEESKSVSEKIDSNGIMNLELNCDKIVQMRVDFDECDVLLIKKISIEHMGKKLFEMNARNFNNYIEYTNGCLIETESNTLKLVSVGNDSHIAFSMEGIECSKSYKYIKRFLLPALYLCICGVVFLIFRLKENEKMGNENYRFIVLASLFGLIYSFAITRWQIPDEYTHLRMIGDGFNNSMYAGIGESIRYSVNDLLPRGISKEFFRHFPAAIGILCGVLFNLPSYWVVQLGELTSLVFYIIVCNQALKLTPVKKPLFETVMLLPMCIQQASSINYDSVLLSLSFFYMAYILYLKYEKEKIVVKDFLILGIILAILAVTKLPYGIMGMMIFILPWSKIDFGEKFKKLSSINKSLRIYGGGGILAVLVLIGLYILRNYYFVKLLITSIMCIPRTMQLFLNTLEHLGDYLLLSMLGNFGALDTPIPWTLAMVIFSFLFLSALVVANSNTNVEKEKKFSTFDRVIIGVSVILIIYMVSISMISHSVLVFGLEEMDNNTIQGFQKVLNTIPYILGLQGRYYIPILLPFLILFPSLFEAKKKSYNRFTFLMENIVLVFTSFTIIQRYLI